MNIPKTLLIAVAQLYCGLAAAQSDAHPANPGVIVPVFQPADFFSRSQLLEATEERGHQHEADTVIQKDESPATAHAREPGSQVDTMNQQEVSSKDMAASRANEKNGCSMMKGGKSKKGKMMGKGRNSDADMPAAKNSASSQGEGHEAHH